MIDEVQELKIYYGALSGLLDTITITSDTILSERLLSDYNKIHEGINAIVDFDLSYLKASTVKVSDYGFGDGTPKNKFEKVELISKCRQLRGILESAFNISDKIVQIGSLYNSIKDEELRSRCGDLLTAHDHFDRVVNQATQILEDRIKIKSGSSKSGKQLINEAIKSDLGSTILVVSDNANEQEGYSSVFRGIMQTLRNDTHHSLATNYTREDAFAVCGFIDQLLRVIDKARLRGN